MSRVVLVVIDGLGHDVAVEECGFLEGLVAAGRARRWRMRSCLPSLSAPLYVTLHTGLAPVDHGVVSNDRLTRCPHPSVFSEACAAGRRTGAVAHGFFCSLLDRGGFSALEDGAYEDDARTIQVGRFYSDQGKTRAHLSIPSDHDLLAMATRLILSQNVDYLLVHLCATDSIGHFYGGGSTEYRCAAWNADNELSLAVPGWQAAGCRVLVTSDHGMSTDGRHGGTIEAMRDVAFYDLGADGGIAGGVAGGVAEGVADQRAVAPTLLGLMGLPPPASMAVPPLA